MEIIINAFTIGLFIGMAILITILYNCKMIYLRKPLNPFLKNSKSTVEVIESPCDFSSVEHTILTRFNTHREIKRWYEPRENNKNTFYIEVRTWL
jgi:hypothetical protein